MQTMIFIKILKSDLIRIAKHVHIWRDNAKIVQFNVIYTEDSTVQS